jgi:hypothetical protein
MKNTLYLEYQVSGITKKLHSGSFKSTSLAYSELYVKLHHHVQKQILLCKSYLLIHICFGYI